MIVIPMAGLSKRFTEAGYNKPKYMLPLGDRTVFSNAISGFVECGEELLFIARNGESVESFIHGECRKLGLERTRVVLLERATAGQAETVELGLVNTSTREDMPITIFNIDTFRPGFSFPKQAWFQESAGYLEVFVGSGPNWSYVEPAESSEPLVLRTAEKNEISNLCCDGLYHFSRADHFLAALQEERRNFPSIGELYVAPLYNHLIRENLKIHYHLIPASEIVFCGIPAEYEMELKRREGQRA